MNPSPSSSAGTPPDRAEGSSIATYANDAQVPIRAWYGGGRSEALTTWAAARASQGPPFG